MEVKELKIQDDDEFLQEVVKQRDFIDKITIAVALAFFVNSIMSLVILMDLIESTEKVSTSFFAGLYIENILVVVTILIVFNKYKF